MIEIYERTPATRRTQEYWAQCRWCFAGETLEFEHAKLIRDNRTKFHQANDGVIYHDCGHPCKLFTFARRSN